MPTITNQLELLRLKELFMSDIGIRSKMAILIGKGKEDPSYSEFCQLVQCTPDIARLFAHQLVINVLLTPEEIASERELLERIYHDTI